MEKPTIVLPAIMRLMNSHLIHLYEVSENTNDIEALLYLVNQLQYQLVEEGLIETKDCF